LFFGLCGCVDFDSCDVKDIFFDYVLGSSRACSMSNSAESSGRI
jgi:hypothetical protein